MRTSCLVLFSSLEPTRHALTLESRESSITAKKHDKILGNFIWNAKIEDQNLSISS